MCAAALSPDQYINRELSWIAFNQRVLAQALDQRTPLPVSYTHLTLPTILLV